MPRLSQGRLVLALAVVLAAGAAVVAGPAGAAVNPSHLNVTAPAQRTTSSGSHLSGAVHGDIHWAIDKPACGSTGTYTCDALERVDVPKGTPGAYAYTAAKRRTGPAGGLTPAALAKAYDYDANRHRQGQTVALVNWFDDPRARSDLNRFDRHYGLPVETEHTFRKVNQAGKAKNYPKASRGSAAETVLDIETVRAVCHTCHILLVEANSPGGAQLADAENTAARLGATEISNSYGTTERHVSSKVRSAYDHPGVVITAATGDAGWYGWDSVNDNARGAGVASFPAADPHVVAVGATTLNLTGSGTRASETVWNNNGAGDSRGVRRGSQGATGGGCSSSEFKAATWQRKHAGYQATQCKGRRVAADVSVVGDPQTGFDVVNSYTKTGAAAWHTYGGTSLSSPLTAALFALAGGAHGSAYPAASLYVNAAHQPYKVYDVTQGGNSFCGGAKSTTCGADTLADTGGYTNNPNAFGLGLTDCTFNRNTSARTATYRAPRSECNATAGYDGPSGLGTPRRPSLFSPTNPKVTLKHPARKASGHKAFVSAKAVERVAGLHPVRYSWSFGDGGGTSGRKPGVHHTWHKKGTYLLTVRVTDSSGQISVAHVHQKIR